MWDLRNPTWGGFTWGRLGITVAAVMILALPFVMRPYVVMGISMQPTFENGDMLLVENISPRLIGYSRGSVVVFRDPRHPEHPIIVKRVVGLPNEMIRITNGAVTAERGEMGVKGEMGGDLPAQAGKWEEGQNPGNGADMEMKLGPEDYFLMGDNRSQSQDSRSWGTIQPHETIGRPVLRVWPLARFGFFPDS